MLIHKRTERGVSEAVPSRTPPPASVFFYFLSNFKEDAKLEFGKLCTQTSLLLMSINREKLSGKVWAAHKLT